MVLENNKYFYLILISSISLATFLNYNANVMGEMNILYENYTNFFRNNFDYNLLFKYDQYTFPMWGFGLVFLLTKNKLLIILIQQIITFITVIKIDKFILKHNLIANQRLFRLMLILSFNLYFFHSSLYPYSISSNMFVLSIIFLFEYFLENNFKKILYSSFFLAILLNMRSDYFYLIFCIYFISLIYILINEKYKSQHIIFFSIWLMIINMSLVPWSIYTKNRTDEYLFTSTNGGHVLFIGLGQLPSNKWGITQSDHDPVMYEFLRTKLNKEKVNSLAHKENQLLMKEWFHLVTESPLEYLRKCLFSAYRLVRSPFYSGNLETLHKINDNEKNIIKTRIKNHLNNFEIYELAKFVLNGNGKIYITMGLFNLFGIFIFLVSIFYILLYLIKTKFRFFKNYHLTVIFLIISYQMSLSIFAFHMPIYNTNIFLIYLITPFYLHKTLYGKKI